MNAPRFIFAGGGTGGHLFPGIAVADELQKRFSTAEMSFLGTNRLVEKQILDEAGYAHLPLETKTSAELYRHPVKFLSKNWKAYRQCYSLLCKNRPDVVVGLGGFSSVPAVTAAYRLKIPVVLLEQNTVPGRANRLLSSMSSVICTSFDASSSYLSKKIRIEQTGNPVRESVLNMENEKQFSRKYEEKTLLILGGSQGASAVNQIVMDSVSLLGKELSYWKIIHQTGSQDYDRVKDYYSDQKINALVEPFFHDMSYCYSKAGLVISRAGATSLAELSVMGLPSILIPYPNSMGNHQLHNAWFYSDKGAAKIVEQEENLEISVSALVGQLRSLLKMDNLREKLCQNMIYLARRHATEDVAKLILEVAGISSRVYQHSHHVHFLKKRTTQSETSSADQRELFS